MWNIAITPKPIENKTLKLFSIEGFAHPLNLFKLNLTRNSSYNSFSESTEKEVHTGALEPQSTVFLFELSNYWTVLDSSFKQVSTIRNIDINTYIWLNDKTYIFSDQQDLSSIEVERQIVTTLLNYDYIDAVNSTVYNINIGGLAVGFQQASADSLIYLELVETCKPILNSTVNINVRTSLGFFTRQCLIFNTPETIDFATLFLYKNKNYYLDSSLAYNTLINIQSNRFIIFV